MSFSRLWMQGCTGKMWKRSGIATHDQPLCLCPLLMVYFAQFLFPLTACLFVFSSLLFSSILMRGLCMSSSVCGSHMEPSRSLGNSRKLGNSRQLQSSMSLGSSSVPAAVRNNQTQPNLAHAVLSPQVQAKQRDAEDNSGSHPALEQGCKCYFFLFLRFRLKWQLSQI